MANSTSDTVNITLVIVICLRSLMISLSNSVSIDIVPFMRNLLCYITKGCFFLHLHIADNTVPPKLSDADRQRSEGHAQPVHTVPERFRACRLGTRGPARPHIRCSLHRRPCAI